MICMLHICCPFKVIRLCSSTNQNTVTVNFCSQGDGLHHSKYTPSSELFNSVQLLHTVMLLKCADEPLRFLALSLKPQEPRACTQYSTHLEASLQMFLQMSPAATSYFSGYTPQCKPHLSHFTDSATAGSRSPSVSNVTASVDQTTIFIFFIHV